MKTTPIISLDFIDTDNTRRTTFEICHREQGKMVSSAIINLSDHGKITRAIYAPGFINRSKAILRLAQRYQLRGTPQRFV